MENGGFLFAAYAIIWAMLFGYVALLHHRQGRLKREIEVLKREIEEKETKP
jgi:CcmD family protein